MTEGGAVNPIAESLPLVEILDEFVPMELTTVHRRAVGLPGTAVIGEFLLGDQDTEEVFLAVDRAHGVVEVDLAKEDRRRQVREIDRVKGRASLEGAVGDGAADGQFRQVLAGSQVDGPDGDGRSGSGDVEDEEFASGNGDQVSDELRRICHDYPGCVRPIQSDRDRIWPQSGEALVDLGVIAGAHGAEGGDGGPAAIGSRWSGAVRSREIDWRSRTLRSSSRRIGLVT